MREEGGYSVKDLASDGLYSHGEIKAGGYNASEFKAIGLKGNELLRLGYSSYELGAFKHTGRYERGRLYNAWSCCDKMSHNDEYC
jgi:hypothetical protein